MSDLDLQIGIENEMFLYLKKDKSPGLKLIGQRDIQPFTNILVPLYNKERGEGLLHADFSRDAGHRPSHTGGRKWNVATDDGMGDMGLDSDSRDVEGYGLEFASPIFDFCRDGTWREEVKNHWVTLLLHGKIAIDNMCATHVHVSPKAEVRWSLKQLKQVAKAVLYFEKAFQAIWAPSRREHKFTRKNKAQNYKLEKLEFGECCKLIEACDDIDHLVALMQPPASSQYNDTLQSDRDYMWNFENTKEDKITGIIEFRCAPGTLTAEHCLIWVELAVSFVQAAAQYGTKAHLETYKPADDGKCLERFILQAGRKGINDPDRLAIVFHGQPVEGDEEMTDIFEKRIKQLGR